MRKNKKEEETPASHSSSSTKSPTSLHSSATSSSSPTCAQLQFIYDFWTFLLCNRDRYPQCKLHDLGAVFGQGLCALCCAKTGACSPSKVVDFLFVPQRQIPWSFLFGRPWRLRTCSTLPGGRFLCVQVVLATPVLVQRQAGMAQIVQKTVWKYRRCSSFASVDVAVISQRLSRLCREVPQTRSSTGCSSAEEE